MRLILLLILPLIAISLLFSGGYTTLPKLRPTPFPTPQNLYAVDPTGSTPTQAEQNLQLRTVKFNQVVLPPPPPPNQPPPPPGQPPPPPGQGGSCGHDSGLSCQNPSACPYYLVTCGNRKCKSVDKQAIPPYNSNSPDRDLTCFDVDHLAYTSRITGASGLGWCNSPDLDPGGNIVSSCMGKPVIYLYPLVDTNVDVSLSIPGMITKSIPDYGKNGWLGVLAHPGGDLEYRGQTYSELYYESSVSRAIPPTDGLIIPRDQLNLQLTDILLKLGLKQVEQDEFLDYWLPKLNNLHSKYILFSVFDSREKNRVDKVDISPEPDTRIEILVYFKPLNKPISIKPLILPKTPPSRLGFTEVEWGGTIDLN